MKTSVVSLLAALLYAGPAVGDPPGDVTAPETNPYAEVDAQAPASEPGLPPGNPWEISVPEGMRIEELSLLAILRYPIHRGGHVNVILNQVQSRRESDGFNTTFQHQLPIVEDVVVYYVDPTFDVGSDDAHFRVDLIVTPDQAVALAKHEHQGFYTLEPVDDQLRFYPLIGPARRTASGDLVRADGTVIVAASDGSEAESQQPDVSTAGNDIQLTPGEPQTIEMHEHEARRVSLEKKIRSASGFNPDIIEVTASGTNGLFIQSSRAGATRLTIVDEGDKPLALTVIVTRDLTDLELLLERLYPDADVEVIPIRDTVLLRGTVVDPAHVLQIEEIAEQFAPTVLNQLHPSRGFAPGTIPSGYRVCTVRVEHSVNALKPGNLVDVLVDLPGDRWDGPAVVTLLRSVQVFAMDPQADPRQVSLLLRPEQVNFVKLAESKGDIRLRWPATAADEASPSQINRELLERLEGIIPDSATGPASATHGTGGAPGAVSRVVALDIGTDPANLDGAEPGDTVDLFATDPGLASPEKIASSVRLVGIVGPKNDHGRYVWLIVPPDVGGEINTKWNSDAVTFSVRVAATSQQYPFSSPQHPVYGAPAGINPPVDPVEDTGAAAPSPQEPDSEFEVLRDDIRALHEDVRRLIELLEDRQERESDQSTRPDDAGTEQGAAQESSRAWTELGIRLEEVASSDARLDHQPYRGALLITEVRDASPADQVGLQSGDLLVGLHEWETISTENVEYVLNHPDRGRIMPLKFYVLRGSDTLFGHFQLQEQTRLERQWENQTGRYLSFEGPTPFSNQPTARPLPVPAREAQPAMNTSGPEPGN